MTTDVRALHVVAAPAGSQAVHVFGNRVVDAEACRWARRIDVAFLAEAGWDAGTQVLRAPPDHPLLGRPVCQVPGCEVTASARARVCPGCRARLARHGLGLDDLDRLPPSRRAATRDADRVARLAAVEDLCLVAACPRPRRHHDGVYCGAHQQRWREARREDPGLDERRWRRTEAPVSYAGEVSFVGLAPLVVAEILLGLQQRCRIAGTVTKDAQLRAFCNELRAIQA